MWPKVKRSRASNHVLKTLQNLCAYVVHHKLNSHLNRGLKTVQNLCAYVVCSY